MIKIDDNDKINLFKKRIGLFVIVDYFTGNGIDTAKGVLKAVSDKGDIEVIHTENKDINWGLNINQIKNYKFSPLKRVGR